MSNVRALLTRVAKLEAARVSPLSPFERAFGSLGAFEDKVRGDIDAGKLDRVDGPLLLQAVMKWHRDGCFGHWAQNRNRAWEYGGR